MNADEQQIIKNDRNILSPCNFGLASVAQCQCPMSHCNRMYSNFPFQSFGWTGRVRNRCTSTEA